MGLTAEKLKEKRQEILDLARAYGAGNVRVFGSVARGEDEPQSDVDFLISMAPGMTLLDHVALWQDLEDLLGCKVDLVNEKALHWFVRDKILKEAVSL